VPAEKAYYMACLDLEGRRCLVVGGGSIGIEKASGLLDCGASVTVVAPQADAGLLELPLEWLRRAYRPSDLDGRYVVVAATSNRSVNRRVFADAEARALLCNVVDTPELCSFILPAVHREGPIAVAVSTGGASPALAQRIRDDVAATIGPEHAELARQLRDRRPWAKENLPTYEARRDYFRRLVQEALA
jgi:precorrin-2 dehydrogenase / sirohydrochlorin ferrochelatase